MDTTVTEAPRCVCCHRPIPAWEGARYACTGCQQRTGTRLAAIPGLYAALPAVLAPGRGTPLVGSRHRAAGSRPPIALGVVDLTGARGDVHATLTSWVRDWAETGDGEEPDWPAGEQRQVGEACRWMRWRLDWACRSHPAIDDAVAEIAALHGRLRAVVTGERGPRRIAVTCRCGGLLRVTVATSGATCRACGAGYGRAEVMALPLADRAAA